MKITLLTLGCKTNQAETFGLMNTIAGAGHRIVDLSEGPDLCVINTCTVTSKADYQSRRLIHRALRNRTKVIVTGCCAELRGEELKKIDPSLEIVKNKDKWNIFNSFILPLSSTSLTQEKPDLLFGGRQRPVVKVQDGCNFSCSYCAITLARGRSRSVPLDEVVEEAKAYADAGFREIVLTGIHLGLYGLDLEPRLSLAGLLKALLKRTEGARFRLSSLEVNELDDEIIDLLGSSRICTHLHLPLQSGDDTILGLMNRNYRSRDFREAVEKVVARYPLCGLGTDVIVGFPGEGGKEFSRTRELIESLPFSYIHVFPYSARPGTRAASLAGRAPEQEKKERVALLRNLGESKKNEFIQRNIGHICEVIVEGPGPQGFTGTSENYMKVLFESQSDSPGKKGGLSEGMLVFTRIAGIAGGRARGIAINEEQLLNK